MASRSQQGPAGTNQQGPLGASRGQQRPAATGSVQSSNCKWSGLLSWVPRPSGNSHQGPSVILPRDKVTLAAFRGRGVPEAHPGVAVAGGFTVKFRCIKAVGSAVGSPHRQDKATGLASTGRAVATPS